MTPPTPTASDAALQRVATDSVVASVWTMVSRVTGLVRIVVVAAVLGPTQFANLYQATNTVPNLLFELLTGTLFASLLVPVLVRHFDAGDEAAATRLANRFLTLSVVAAALVVLLVVLAGPLVLGILTAGVPDGVRSTGTGLGWLLLGLLLLQVPLYLWVGMAAAVQNARGRFALPAAAPSVENVVIIVVLGAYALAFGTGMPYGHGLAEVALLGGGSTIAVLLHAAVQWWGAHRCGARLALAWSGWRDAEVLGIVRLAVPSLGYASLTVARYFCVLIVAAAVPGGVVAMTIAYAFYTLPVALTARPVAQASLPPLSRAFHRGDDLDYRETFNRGLGLALFLTVPASIAYALLSEPLTLAVTYGEMASSEGRELLRYCLLGISLGVVGQAAVEFATLAAYARRDAARPLRAVALRTLIAVAGMLSSLALLDGPVLLLAVGISIAVSDVVAGVILCWAVGRPLPRPPTSLARTVARTVLAGLAMLPVGLLLLEVVSPPTGRIDAVLVTLLVGAGGAAAYLGVQWALRSPEIAGLFSLIRRVRRTAGAGRG